MMADEKIVGTSFAGIAEATLTIIVTTLEDCVWLVPLVAQAGDARIAFVHGLIFVATFVGLSIVICATALLLQNELSSQVDEQSTVGADVILEAAGAVLCWALAAYFYCKACSKKGSRRKETEQEELRLTDTEYGAIPVDEERNGLVEPTVMVDGTPSSSFIPTDPVEPATDKIQPWMIISLTVAGSLDEVSYFPGLVVGKIFTPFELCIGTLLASLLMLALVDLLVRRCTRCLHILEQVPLYAVIALFAVILTLQVAWDLAK